MCLQSFGVIEITTLWTKLIIKEMDLLEGIFADIAFELEKFGIILGLRLLEVKILIIMRLIRELCGFYLLSGFDLFVEIVFSKR